MYLILLYFPIYAACILHMLQTCDRFKRHSVCFSLRYLELVSVGTEAPNMEARGGSLSSDSKIQSQVLPDSQTTQRDIPEHIGKSCWYTSALHLLSL